jgi:hypothetical protein
VALELIVFKVHLKRCDDSSGLRVNSRKPLCRRISLEGIGRKKGRAKWQENMINSQKLQVERPYIIQSRMQIENREINASTKTRIIQTRVAYAVKVMKMILGEDGERKAPPIIYNS